MVLRPVNLFSKATDVVETAMERAGVRRLICVTGFGTGDSRPRMSFLESIPFRLLLGRVYDDEDIQEGIVRRSSLDWVIARPGILTDGSKGRYNALDDRTAWRNGIITRANAADFVVSQIDGTSSVGKAPVLVS